MRKLLSLSLVMALTVVLAGCTPNNTTSVTVTNSNGSQVTIEGDATDSGAKSSNWPSYIPTPSGATNFSYAKLSDTYYLSYDLAGSTNVSTAFDAVNTAVTSGGWSGTADSSLETEDAILRNYSRGGDTMILTVSKSDSGTVEVAIIAGPDQNN